MSSNESLEKWIVSFYQGPSFQKLSQRFTNIQNCLTSSQEVAMLYGLTQKIRPQVILEIGTYFAATTRILAEALNDICHQGKIVTIDPFGNYRVPGILKKWPKALQALVDYKPWNSMHFFMNQEDESQKKIRMAHHQKYLDLVFVDGNHNLEYALFDIMGSAEYIRPGGAIVVDNLEQDGPRKAVFQFLCWNPSWKLFHDGKIISTSDLNPELIHINQDTGVNWAVLLSPSGIQIANQSFKINRLRIAERYINNIRFYAEEITEPGSLHVNINYFSMPHHHHLTGKGHVSVRQNFVVPVNDQQKLIDFYFDPPLYCGSEKESITIGYEMELRFTGERSQAAYLLLNANCPLKLFPEVPAQKRSLISFGRRVLNYGIRKFLMLKYFIASKLG